MKTVLLTSLLLLSSIVSCNKKLTKFQAFMDDADNFALYEVDQFATPINEQADDKEYLSDYEIYKQIDLEKPAIEQLKIILGDSTTYSQEDVKSCPFIGKYGISITNKKAEYVHLIVSSKNCAKCQVFASDQEMTGHFDIINLELYKLLEKGMGE